MKEAWQPTARLKNKWTQKDTIPVRALASHWPGTHMASTVLHDTCEII